MDKVLDIVNLGRACRSSSGVKNRQPLDKVMVASAFNLELGEELSALVKDELNVENVEILANADDYVSYDIKPQLRTVGPKYGKFLGAIKQKLAQVNPVETVNMVKGGEALEFEVDNTLISLGEEDLLIALKNKEGYASESNGELTVVLDTNLNDSLIEKGFINEFVSKVQNLRKDSGFEVVNHIKVQVCGDNWAINVLNKHCEEFSQDVLADEFSVGENGDYSTEFNFDGKVVKIFITKV